jgi:hypothetical protein
MKTAELTGAALDWAVAKCEGVGLGPRGFVVYYYEGEPAMWQPSTDWAQGGPIIERWEIDTNKSGLHKWRAKTISLGRLYDATGQTPLEAAMRCYVASKLGDTVDIPKELHP